MKKCPYCNAQIDDESKFCGECGREYPNGKSCRYCGSIIHEGDVYCEHCGKMVGDADQTSQDLKQPESNVDHIENVTVISEYEKEKAHKKYLAYIVAALALLILIGCGWWYFNSSGPQLLTKEIKPTSTEFTYGELAKLIEIVDEPCQLSFTEQDGVIETQFIKLKVKLRLTKELQKFRGIDARDISFTRLLSVAFINLVDENDTKVQDLDIKSDDLLKLKKLLQGKVGDVETIAFEGKFHNSTDAPTWFEQTTAFTPSGTADIDISENNPSDEDSENNSSEGDLSNEYNESLNDYDMFTESDDYSTGRSGSEDWDALLVTYEEYTNQIISEIRKGTDNMDLSNYTSLIEKAQKLSDKMEKAESSMSASQLTRFNKITLKLSQALQQMNE